MELTFKLEVNAPKEAIWSYYADLEKRHIWEEDLESIKFDGELQTGTTGTMKLEECQRCLLLLLISLLIVLIGTELMSLGWRHIFWT